MFDSDVGHSVGFTPYGERWARNWNSDPQWMEYKRGQVDNYCRHNYEVSCPFLTERRDPQRRVPRAGLGLPAPRIAFPVHPSANKIPPSATRVHQVLA
ncbi:unnamed protein product [Coccothraustes coccothraustes]